MPVQAIALHTYQAFLHVLLPQFQEPHRRSFCVDPSDQKQRKKESQYLIQLTLSVLSVVSSLIGSYHYNVTYLTLRNEPRSRT